MANFIESIYRLGMEFGLSVKINVFVLLQQVVKLLDQVDELIPFQALKLQHSLNSPVRGNDMSVRAVGRLDDDHVFGASALVTGQAGYGSDVMAKPAKRIVGIFRWQFRKWVSLGVHP